MWTIVSITHDLGIVRVRPVRILVSRHLFEHVGNIGRCEPRVSGNSSSSLSVSSRQWLTRVSRSGNYKRTHKVCIFPTRDGSCKPILLSPRRAWSTAKTLRGMANQHGWARCGSSEREKPCRRPEIKTGWLVQIPGIVGIIPRVKARTPVTVWCREQEDHAARSFSRIRTRCSPRGA